MHYPVRGAWAGSFVCVFCSIAAQGRQRPVEQHSNTRGQHPKCILSYIVQHLFSKKLFSRGCHVSLKIRQQKIP